jgi:hypothetical protein
VRHDLYLCGTILGTHIIQVSSGIYNIYKLSQSSSKEIYNKGKSWEREEIIHKYCYVVHLHRFLSYQSKQEVSEPNLTKNMRG